MSLIEYNNDDLGITRELKIARKAVIEADKKYRACKFSTIPNNPIARNLYRKILEEKGAEVEKAQKNLWRIQSRTS